MGDHRVQRDATHEQHGIRAQCDNSSLVACRGGVILGTVAFRTQWIGMGSAIIGLIILLGLNPASIISVDAWGFIGMIVASLFYGIGSQLSKSLLNALSTGWSMIAGLSLVSYNANP